MLHDITKIPIIQLQNPEWEINCQQIFSALTGEHTTIFWSHIYSHLLGFH